MSTGREAMSKRDLRAKPHHLNDDWWWYEEPQGICIVHYMGIRRGAYTVKISWRALRAALKRLDKEGKS